MKLYDYYRSSASYRVRIALNLKQIDYEKITVHLVNHGGEQHLPHYLALNPQGLVPCLEENGNIITQSLAILDYINEQYPLPNLLPADPISRAKIKSLSLMIACDIHPLNNLRVTQYLKNEFQANEEQIQQWYHHWLKQGFDAFESMLQPLPRSKSVCYGDQITFADICLIPQVFNAKRFGFSLEKYPLISQIDAYCNSLAAFIKAAPNDN